MVWFPLKIGPLLWFPWHSHHKTAPVPFGRLVRSPLRNMSLTCEENRWKAAVPNLGRHVSWKEGCDSLQPWKNPLGLLGSMPWASQGPYIFRGRFFMVNHLGWKKVPAMSLPRVLLQRRENFRTFGNLDEFMSQSYQWTNGYLACNVHIVFDSW